MADADVIIIGAGLAGLVAAAELIDAGKKDHRCSIRSRSNRSAARRSGRSAVSFWSTRPNSAGWAFAIRTNSRCKIGWGTAAFDRAEDLWPRRWAEAYVAFAAGEKRAWLRARGLRFFPVVGWAERGGDNAIGHGNSVPRFHLTWGTGPGRDRAVRAARA